MAEWQRRGEGCIFCGSFSFSNPNVRQVSQNVCYFLKTALHFFPQNYKVLLKGMCLHWVIGKWGLPYIIWICSLLRIRTRMLATCQLFYFAKSLVSIFGVILKPFFWILNQVSLFDWISIFMNIKLILKR